MYKSILVSLDGSALAEQALLPALSIAAKFGATVLLLRVVPPDRNLPSLQYLTLRPTGTPSDPVEILQGEAQAYLDGLSLPMAGVPVHTRVLVGAPPEMIIATAVETAVDLIVMSTHGRTGLTRLLYGSVAEAVLRGSPVPVLLVPNRVTVRQPDEEHHQVHQGAFSTIDL
jgi:nucleotide-binding universal stress UspA family protein